MYSEGSKVHGPPIPNKWSNEHSLRILDMMSNGRKAITNVTNWQDLQTIPAALAKATGTRKLQRAPSRRLFQSNGTRSRCRDPRATKHEWSATTNTRPRPLLAEPAANRSDWSCHFLEASATAWRRSDCRTCPGRCRTRKTGMPYSFHPNRHLV